ncbi:MAG: extensin family protein [Hyphomicrobiales bacterium]
MVSVRALCVLIAALVVITGCAGPRGQYFTTEGLIIPTGICPIPPSSLGIAEQLPPINERNGCQVPNPWQVESVATVSFNRPAKLNCGMVSPLASWFQDSVQPAAKSAFGEEVVSVNVLASYACRPRNNHWGGKLSEHGFGNAIDIGGFTLASGRTVTVRSGWAGAPDEQQFLRSVRHDACQTFSTVLGPGSDGNHEDHFHLDMMARKSGRSAYCG